MLRTPHGHQMTGQLLCSLRPHSQCGHTGGVRSQVEGDLGLELLEELVIRQDVAVVGNNDEALEEALFLTKYAQNIHLIVPTPELKAREALAHEAESHPKIKVRLGTRLKEITGNGKVNGIVVHPRKSPPESLPVSGAFVYLQGSQPITDYLMGQLDTTEEGCLLVDSEMQTSIPGVFAIGDLLCTHIKQAVVAASDGVIAAVAADKYVNGRKKAVVDWK